MFRNRFTKWECWKIILMVKLATYQYLTKALTSTEVLKLYANGVPQDLTNFTPAPVAWYPLGSNSFWNGSQWTVRDMIGSNDGTGTEHRSRWFSRKCTKK